MGVAASQAQTPDALFQRGSFCPDLSLALFYLLTRQVAMGVAASGETSEAFKVGLRTAATESSNGDLKALFNALPPEELAKLRTAMMELKTPRCPQPNKGVKEESPSDEHESVVVEEAKAEWTEQATAETSASATKAEAPALPETKAVTDDGDAAEPSVEAKAEAQKAGLTEAQIENVAKSFKAIDTDGSNAIEEDELRGVLKAIDVEATDEEVSTVLKNIDADGNGKLDADEYLKMVALALKGGPGAVV
eukprot:CAMPEP_0117484288 /NCGR_PEP_ID=MMETSP0784-20121206/14381_1 /TAXON_ID=39447 /ORGANISM="" /LENGTH=249 /DNA_ID=CAMNT_0005278857 /DNA_START=87 /DNA_END=833 /DNA_ORIENTATION=-